MFHTNYTRIEKEYRCDEGCIDTGGCKGHKMEFIINSTAGVAELKVDGESAYWFDCNEAEALYDLFKQLKS